MPIDNKTTIQLSQFDEKDVMGLIDLSASVKPFFGLVRSLGIKMRRVPLFQVLQSFPVRMK